MDRDYIKALVEEELKQTPDYILSWIRQWVILYTNMSQKDIWYVDFAEEVDVHTGETIRNVEVILRKKVIFDIDDLMTATLKLKNSGIFKDSIKVRSNLPTRSLKVIIPIEE
jgi:hypothetical protein